MGIDKWLYDYAMSHYKRDCVISRDDYSCGVNTRINSFTYKEKLEIFVMANFRRLKVYENVNNVISPIIF